MLWSQAEHPELITEFRLPTGAVFSGLRADKISGAVIDAQKLVVLLDEGDGHTKFIRTDLNDPEKTTETALVRMLDTTTHGDGVKELRLIDAYNIKVTTRVGLKWAIRWNENGDVFREGVLIAHKTGWSGPHSQETDDARRVGPPIGKQPGSVGKLASRDSGLPVPIGAFSEPSEANKGGPYMLFSSIAAILAGVAAWLWLRVRGGTRK